MFKYFDPNTQLINTYKSLGYDVHEESINYKYIIQPLVEFLNSNAKKEYFDLNAFLSLVNGVNTPDELLEVINSNSNAAEILDFFLRTKGYESSLVKPHIYYIDLYMNEDQYKTVLGTTKTFANGSITINIGGSVIKNETFELSSADFISAGSGLFKTSKKKFYSYSLNVENLKVGDVFYPSGFQQAIVVGVEEGYFVDDLGTKLTQLFESFSMFKTYNKKNIKRYIKNKYGIDVDIIGTDDNLMIRDLSMTDDHVVFHDGGKVDIYYTEHYFTMKTFVGDALSTAGVEIMTADSAYFPSFGNPLKDYSYPINDIDLAGWTNFFDVNADRFIKSNLFYIEMSKNTDSNIYPVMGIDSVYDNSGRKLEYREDYIYISIDRGYTFTEKNKILIFFKTNPGNGVIVNYIAPGNYREIKQKLESDEYIAPIGIDIMVKVKPAIFVEVYGQNSGTIYDISVNSEISAFSSITLSRLLNILKNNGAKGLTATKMKMIAYSYALGRYESETTILTHKLNRDDFSQYYPFDKATDFTVLALNPNAVK